MAKRNIKVIGIGGVPATGKTTLVKGLRKKMKLINYFKFGKLKGECYNNNVFLLGIYNEHLFSGTDRLSMAVQPDVVEFFKKLNTMPDEFTVIYEGDRLFNNSFIEAVEEYAHRSFYILTADPDTVEQRHVDRKDTQTKTFKKSRKTKMKNILEKNESIIKLLRNKNKKDLSNNIETIWQDLKNTI